MKVIDLIIELQKHPGDLEAMVYATKDGSAVFKFVSVGMVEEIGLGNGQQICAIIDVNHIEVEEDDGLN